MTLREDLHAALHDPDAAARVLLYAAELLRRGDALPAPLAQWLADAFEVAAHKETPEERVKMLGRELHLTREKAGRPAKMTDPALHQLDVLTEFTGEPRTVEDLDGLVRRRLERERLSPRTVNMKMKRVREIRAESAAQDDEPGGDPHDA